MASTVQQQQQRPSGNALNTKKKTKLKCIQYEEPGQISEYYYFSGSESPPPHETGNHDSGLSSDGTGEGFTPPPLIRRMTSTARPGQLRTGEEDSHSDVSGDSLASEAGSNSIITPDGNNRHVSPVKKALPSSLLKEIRIKGQQQQKSDNDGHQKAVKELSKAVESQLKVANTRNNKTSSRHVKHAIPTNICPNPSLDFEFYRFHLRENVVSLPDMTGCNSSDHQLGGSEDLSFVGLKDILSLEKSATIRSHKSGTVRGVRNRVRAGITTYLQGKTFKSYAEREQGKVVVYTTSMGVVRQTYQRCLQVQRILGTLLINYEERDVSMNRQVQQELKERMNRNRIVIPQVFVEGQLLGDADVIEKLNESGDLRQILRRYKRIGPETICDTCGGYRYLPCTACNGSKKSIHRNHFTAEFVALKCITCNEAGLIRCAACCSSSTVGGD